MVVTVEKRDTMATVIRQTLRETVPMSRARITISVDSLLRLPAGASYHKRSGQAEAEVALVGDTVYVTATCDSLEREVEYYEALYRNARDALESYHESVSEEQKSRKSPVGVYLRGMCCGVAATLGLIFFIKQLKSRKNE